MRFAPIADAQRSARTDRLQAQANDAQAAALEKNASDYRRAMSACLEVADTVFSEDYVRERSRF